jgi:hypothetical protein
MDEAVKKAFDFAADLTKQLISLATGIIGLTITFGRDFLQRAPAGARPWAITAWGAFLFSILCGILTLMTLTGTLDPGKPAVPLSVRGSNVTTFPNFRCSRFLPEWC